MLGGGASMAIASIWTNIANWSTPRILFCVLNLMIAIIFIASNSSNNHHHGNSPRQLTRSPSMLERVKSVNLSSFYSTTTQDSHDHYIGDDHELSRGGSSLLQRVKSITSTFSSTISEQVNSTSELTDSEQVNTTKELTRAPSFLDRVRSFKLTSPFKSDSPPDVTFTRQDEHFDVPPDHGVVEDHNVTSDNSRYVSRKSRMNLSKRSTSHLTKSSSEKRVVESNDDEEDVDQRRPATMRASTGVKHECVDAKADDFIKRFKQQLKLQRLDSLQRFRDMLNRGT